FVCHPIFLHLAWEYLNQPGITLFILLHQCLVRITLSLKFPPGINVRIMIMFLLYDKFSFITYIKRLLHHLYGEKLASHPIQMKSQLSFTYSKPCSPRNCTRSTQREEYPISLS